MVVFQMHEQFQLAVLSAVLYSFVLILIGYLLPGRIRGKVLTKAFLRANFDKEHRDATGQNIETTNGYPDMGHGRYADKLSYKDWLDFGKAQRAHYNFLELWGPQTLFILVGALEYPIFSAVLGFAAILGRILYALGYMISAGTFNIVRSSGSLIGDSVLVISLVLSIISCSDAYTR